MKRVFKRNSGQLLFLGVMAVLLMFLYIKAQPVNSDTHNLLTSDLRELQALDIELGETVLQHHYQLFHNYDGVVATMQRMHELSAALLQCLQKGLLPDTPEMRHELGEIQKQIEQKADALEKFKSDNAVSKTAYLYLPTTVNAIKEQLPKSDILQHEKFNRLLRDA